MNRLISFLVACLVLIGCSTTESDSNQSVAIDVPADVLNTVENHDARIIQAIQFGKFRST